MTLKRWGFAAVLVFSLGIHCWAADTVKLGFNFPKSGPYSRVGMDEWRAAKIAVEEINASGGILGRQVEIVWRDSESQVSKTMENVTELIEKQGVQMIFGGVSSAVAIVCGDLCQKYGVLFMATVTASNATTGKDGHRHTFRVGYNSWMGGKALGSYLKQRFRDKTYFYITADYTWGWSSEASLRYFTGTQDSERHKVALVPFPDAMESDFYKALFMASAAKPDVLVLNLFGKHMEMALSMVADLGLKKKMQVVVPVLELSQAEQSGPQTMAGIIGVADWIWRVPYQYNYARGKAFVEKFVQINGRYPCFGASSAYTVLYEYKSAVERAGTFKPVKVIKALEGHTFELLKDQEQWRALDHQCIQSVYLLKCKPAAEVIKDRFKEDYFEILESFPGEQVVRTEAEWIADRQRAGKPPVLEPLPGE